MVGTARVMVLSVAIGAGGAAGEDLLVQPDEFHVGATAGYRWERFDVFTTRASGDRGAELGKSAVAGYGIGAGSGNQQADSWADMHVDFFRDPEDDSDEPANTLAFHGELDMKTVRGAELDAEVQPETNASTQAFVTFGASGPVRVRVSGRVQTEVPTLNGESRVKLQATLNALSRDLPLDLHFESSTAGMSEFTFTAVLNRRSSSYDFTGIEVLLEGFALSEAGDAITECAMNVDLRLDVVEYCAGDLDASGSLTLDDIDAFAAAFPAGDPNADVNLDGRVDAADLDALLAAFQTGCPG